MKNIILVGLMGAGKTTVGRRLSQKIGWEFVDTDSLVEKNCGTSVNVIFEVEGEKGFRLREKKVIEMVMNRGQQIIETGGGAPTLEKNRKFLSKGFVIYLSTIPCLQTSNNLLSSKHSFPSFISHPWNEPALAKFISSISDQPTSPTNKLFE